MFRTLVVTAVPAERDAVLGGRSPSIGMVHGMEVYRAGTEAGLVDVVAGGIGPVAAAVATACALRQPYDLVISTGIAGGFPPAGIGDVVIGSASVHADLGADTDTGFTSMADFGWGAVRFELDARLAQMLACRLMRSPRGAHQHTLIGAVLTVSTVTGNQRRADALRRAYPDALAEAMEGVGALQAARQTDTPFAELRTISNLVGPRRREDWRIDVALAALTAAFDALFSGPLVPDGVRSS